MNSKKKKVKQQPKKKPTKAELRVAVAKDVLAQIKAKTYNMKNGLYLTSSEFRNENCKISNEKFQDIVKNTKSCEVCALGSLFMSKVKKFNNFKFDEYVNNLFKKDNIYTDSVYSVDNVTSQNMMFQGLKDIFPIKMLNEIENHFEGECININKYSDIIDEDAKYREWKRNIADNDNEETMIAICENIIKNKGDFKPKLKITCE